MNDHTKLEIMAEVAWQIGDTLKNTSRAESRWRVVNIGLLIIDSGLITETTEDIDEVIHNFLTERGIK